MNFLDPWPDTGFASLAMQPVADAVRAIGALQLVLPRPRSASPAVGSSPSATCGARDVGLLGGINALIVGNYLTALDQYPDNDVALRAERGMGMMSSRRCCDLLPPLRRLGERRGPKRHLLSSAAPISVSIRLLLPT